MTYEQAQALLSDIVDSYHPEIFTGLNGGILLLPEAKLHPQSVGESLYILGEYHYDPNGFGRYITIYFGSFQITRGHCSEQEQAEKLREILCHELTHHLEHLAGDTSLEQADAAVLADYHRRYA